MTIKESNTLHFIERLERVERVTEKYIYTVEFITYAEDMYFLAYDIINWSGKKCHIQEGRVCKSEEEALKRGDQIKACYSTAHNFKVVKETIQSVTLVHHRRKNKAGL